MNTLPVRYSWELILVSVAISMVAAYAAFSLADRMRGSRRRGGRIGWLLCGAAAMGLGIWSMHYLGMRAQRLAIPVTYYVPTVALSLLLAIGAAAVALVVVSAERLGWSRLLAGGLLMGGGIGGMHYVGMSAMRMCAMHHYSPVMVTISVLLAVGLSTLALWMAFALRDSNLFGRRTRMLGGAIMGIAIASMHYTAMAGVTYTSDMSMSGTEWTVRITSLGDGAIAAVTLLVLVLALVSAALHRRQVAELQSVQRELLESQQRLMEANAMLEELAMRDGLTGLHNRRHFDLMLDIEWRRAVRKGEPLGLLVIDVDHFKALNDLDGHQAGDDCLRRVAEALDRHTRRPHDVLARYGGEEFAMLLPDAGAESAARIAEEMRRLVQAEAVLHGASSTADVVTVSIGVCSRVPAKGTTAEQLLHCADEALYTAKARGRNRVVFAGDQREGPNLQGISDLMGLMNEAII